MSTRTSRHWVYFIKPTGQPEIRRRFDAGESIVDISPDFPVREENIGFIVRRVTWKNVA